MPFRCSLRVQSRAPGESLAVNPVSGLPPHYCGVPSKPALGGRSPASPSSHGGALNILPLCLCGFSGVCLVVGGEQGLASSGPVLPTAPLASPPQAL